MRHHISGRELELEFDIQKMDPSLRWDDDSMDNCNISTNITLPD